MGLTDALLIVAGYLSGSIPWGLVIYYLVKRGDIRSVGSRNIGATNVARNAGLIPGLLTLLLDIAKGLVPILVTQIAFADLHPWTPALVAVAAICGHMFPIWLCFKGGKGVATGAGVFFGLSWQVALVPLVVFAITFFFSRIVSLSSIIAAVSFAVAGFAIGPYLGMEFPLQIAALIAVSLIVFKHHENIARLLNGTEKRLSTGGRKESSQ